MTSLTSLALPVVGKTATRLVPKYWIGPVGGRGGVGSGGGRGRRRRLISRSKNSQCM